MEFKDKIDKECAFHKEDEKVCMPVEIVNKLTRGVANRPVDKPEDTITHLKERYGCETEVCVLSQDEVKNKLGHELTKQVMKENFKPKGPGTTTAWLSNTDIDAVLTQIQKKYEHRHFLHIPFQMRDFAKTNTELNRLNWQKEYEQGYRTFGAVVNTDFSTGHGIHWFAIFADFSSDPYTIEYFNSSGELPLPEIMAWMKKLKHSLNFDKEIKDVIATRIQNQKDDHSCGPYSLYYIVSRLDGVPHTWFKHNKIGDDRMVLFRQYLFREY